MDNRSYYDDFAAWYERERGSNYHRLIDDLEVELVERLGAGKRVLEVGCGTGLILGRAAEHAHHAVGIDLSAGMLRLAARRRLCAIQASATALPFRDESFDLVYSFKVLAHISAIREALAEMARVTKPGGAVLAEFYGARSLRYLVKRLKPPSKISESTDDEAVFTRYDDVAAIRSYVPEGMSLTGLRGVRIVTPISHVHRIPLLGSAVAWAEKHLADASFAAPYGGFIIATLHKSP